MTNYYLFSGDQNIFRSLVKDWAFKNSKRAYLSLPVFFIEGKPSQTECEDGGIAIGCAFEEFEFGPSFVWSKFTYEGILHSQHAAKLHYLLDLCKSGDVTEAILEAKKADTLSGLEGMSYEDAVLSFVGRAYSYKICPRIEKVGVSS